MVILGCVLHQWDFFLCGTIMINLPCPETRFDTDFYSDTWTLIEHEMRIYCLLKDNFFTRIRIFRIFRIFRILMAYPNQNPLVNGCVRFSPAPRECVATPEVDMAVQGRCLEEGIAFEIPVGRVQMTTSNGMSHEVSLDGKVFKMSNRVFQKCTFSKKK